MCSIERWFGDGQRGKLMNTDFKNTDFKNIDNKPTSVSSWRLTNADLLFCTVPIVIFLSIVSFS